MFGYIRVLKAEMKVREFERYRSVYCGLCKAIAADYGQLPRLAVSYDLSFLLLLLQSLDPSNPEIRAERCVLQPFRPHPVTRPDVLLKKGAAAAVLLAAAKLDDNKKDGDQAVATAVLDVLTGSARRKAQRQEADLAELIARRLAHLTALESARAGLEAQAEAFGDLTAELAQALAEPIALGDDVLRALGLLFAQLGSWVYLIDALDDFARDQALSCGSFIKAATGTEAVARLEPLLQAREWEMEKIAALLPYQRDAGIVANVLLDGLGAERLKVQERVKAGAS